MRKVLKIRILRCTKLEFLKLNNNPGHPGFKVRSVLVLPIPDKKGLHRLQTKIILLFILSTQA
jgi:hypothetical protein